MCGRLLTLKVQEAIRWNNFCRSQTPVISFVKCVTTGVFGSVFVDHGDEFMVQDPDGAPALLKLAAPFEAEPRKLPPHREDKVPLLSSPLAFSEETDENGEAFTRVSFITPAGQEARDSFPQDSLVSFSDVEGCLSFIPIYSQSWRLRAVLRGTHDPQSPLYQLKARSYLLEIIIRDSPWPEGVVQPA